MNNELKEIIQKVRTSLDNNPGGILLGQIRKGNPSPQITDIRGELSEYMEFLKECDGASFGEIDLFPSNEAGKNQFYVETLQGGQDNWLFIGLALYEPIIINRLSGDVYRFYRDVPTEIPQECFGKFNEFLSNYAFGKKYAELVSVDENDDWLELLKELSII